MKKYILSALVVVVIIVAGYFFIKKEKTLPVINEAPSTSAAFDGKNTSFLIDGKEITLVNGVSEVEVAPNSASKITTKYFGNDITGDLTGDGVPDTAYLVTQTTGGSGVFYYAVVAMKTQSGYKNTNAFFIGDRIAPQNMYIPGGTTELNVNFAERKAGEPMTARPSQGAVTLLKVTKEGVLEGLMK